MSSISNLSSAPAVLPALNLHPHGHKKGPHVDSTNDSSNDTAAQGPAGAAQNLFGKLLQSLEQVIGLNLTTATAATAATTAIGATSPTGAASAAVGGAAASAAAGRAMAGSIVNAKV